MNKLFGMALLALLTYGCTDGSSRNGSGSDSIAEILDPASKTSPAPVNISDSLEEVLEFGKLASACAQYDANPEDRNLMLMCGKYYFFYDGLGTPGPPLPLLQVMANELPAHVGAGFERIGGILDPYSSDNLPVGFGAAPSYGSVEAKAFTCAACHFGKTEEGIYVTGLGNFELDYGKELLYMMLVPNVIVGFEDRAGLAEKFGPEVAKSIEAVLTPLDLDAETQIRISATINQMGIDIFTSGGEVAPFVVSDETPYFWTTWAPGVLDFFTSPFPDEGVHIPIRIPSLWEIPNSQDIKELGLRHAMLQAGGGGDSLENFVRGFIMTSGGDQADWSDDDIRPIVEYIYSLQHPQYTELRGALDTEKVEAGRALFDNEGCIDCHDGKSYGGKDIFYFGDETPNSRTLATDSTLQFFADPDQDFQICCDLTLLDGSELTHGLKAPHLTGIWAHRVFLHNGSVASLEELLCRMVQGLRPIP